VQRLLAAIELKPGVFFHKEYKANAQLLVQ
jgi:hypothetical protein